MQKQILDAMPNNSKKSLPRQFK